MIWVENIYVRNSQSQILEVYAERHVDSLKIFEYRSAIMETGI